MATKPAEPIPSLNSDLQRTFENAVRGIDDAEIDSRVSRYRTPIVQRPRAHAEGSGDTQKKALSDAAKALALLWKVSSNPTR